jgi:uracil-DNA glycosylase
VKILDSVRVVVGLGAIGTKAAIDALKENNFSIEPQRWRFGHGMEIAARNGRREIAVIASFHPSRQNTNTGKLTTAMFDAIFTRARALCNE